MAKNLRGKSAELLQSAPEAVVKAFAGKVAAEVGPGRISHELITATIKDHSDGGTVNWFAAVDSLADMAKRVREGRPPKPKARFDLPVY